MKTLSVLLLSSVCVIAAPPFVNVTWPLLWDQPTNMPVLSVYVPGTNQAYKIYGTSTLGTPQSQWPLLAMFTSWSLVTNGPSISLSNSVTLPFALSYFFAINPTNVWGEPPFLLGYSATLVTGPPWSTVNSLVPNRQGP